IQFIESYIPDVSSVLSYIAQLKEPHYIFNDTDFEGDSLRSFFDQMVSEVNQKAYGFYTYIYNRITSLLLQMIRKWYKSGIDLNHDEIINRDSSSLHEALIYIDRHSNESISIEHLAKLSNMSYSYFAKQFHSKYGQSCKQYIEFVRLIKAENLLLFTDYDLSYIANETGFSDCSHLIRCFKRKYNTTPKQFRKSHGL
nr:AraC family transcriptional regulator [Eubacterium sp.]